MPFLIEDAAHAVLAFSSRLPIERRPLLDALGSFVTCDMHAPRPHPPFPASIKDGYAVCSADGAGEFEVIGATRAGDPGAPALAARQAAYITTGAPLPAGCDAVVMVESVVELPPPAGSASSARHIRIESAPRPGQEVRAIGSDAAAGALLVSAGSRLGAAELGLLGSAGCSSVSVVRRPTVCVLSTGNELLDPLASAPLAADGDDPVAASPAAHQIHDSNRPALLAAAAAEGAATRDLGIAADDPAALEAALDAALACGAQVLVCSGGVSVGDRDLVKPLLARRGVVHFGKVLMKPGKPLTFATVPRPAAAGAGGAPPLAPPPLLVFGLPGNPVSSLVCFHLVVAPALRAMSGDLRPRPRRAVATLEGAVKCDPERPEYHRAVLVASRAGWVARSTGGQISSRLLSCRSADALIELPQASATLAAGSTVSVLLLGSVGRGVGAADDELSAPLPPAPPAPAPAPAVPPAAAPPAAAPPAAACAPLGEAPRSCRIGVVAHLDAADGGDAARRAARAVLDVLARGLAPGSWLVETRELAPSATAAERWGASRALCDERGGCSLLLHVSAPAHASHDDEARRPELRAAPAIGSVVRAACLRHAPGAALLGEWGAASCAGAMLLSLPAHAEAAAAGLLAALPLMPHAVAQAGERPPPTLGA